MPNATVAERVEALLSKAEAIAIRRTPHHRGRPKAVGFKTAKSCVWDPTSQRYRPTPVYDDASTAALADVWRGAGVRVICLARLNGLAWEISRARKLVINAFYDEVRAKALEVFALLGDGALARDDVIRGVAKNESIAQFRAELSGGQASTILAGLLDAPDQLKHALPKAVDNATWAAAVSAAATRAATFTVPLDCSRRGLSKIANETLEHVRQFHGECASLCVEINRCVGCTRQFFTKSFLGDDAAVLARSSGEEPTSPRHRAGFVSMAWRSTRRFRTNAP